MGDSYELSDGDKDELSQYGISHEEAHRQLQLLTGPPNYAPLIRACTIGDGIHVLPKSSHQELVEHHNQASAQGRFIKFVPASGAASRMFRELLTFHAKPNPPEWSDIQALDSQGNREAHAFIFFIENLKRFPFYEALAEVLEKRGIDLDEKDPKEIYSTVLECLLTDAGLNYAALPKALLAFHNYSISSRTAFEEHLVEASAYTKTVSNFCRLHFTVSPEHLNGLQVLFDGVRDYYQRMLSAHFEVGFSLQKKSTDMLAIGPDHKPFRDEAGNILLRPGGHGALIENLMDLSGDLIFVKNIDNVQPDRLKAATILNKKLLGGLLVKIQSQTFAHLHWLNQSNLNEAGLDEILAFAKNELHIPIPQETWVKLRDLQEKRELLIQKLNRPIRVCGVVKNTGEPGGGPFWVTDQDGIPGLQIVEGAQIDHYSPSQSKIFYSSTHFNPVDLVCGVRNYLGQAFDLPKHVDPNAVIVTKKSYQGRDLTACERPGLWNGAMADWITIFVEVPEQTFTPVKTVNDLLRPSHQ